jgi:ABC-type transporter Mla MlaB component
MATGGAFSLSVSRRGLDFVIGGSGSLDLIGVSTLRKACEEACETEGATLHLDLSTLAQVDADVVASLVEVGGFCREREIPLTLSLSPETLAVLAAAGYDDRLLPSEG